MQTDRYDLRKHFDAIKAKRDKNKLYTIVGKLKNGGIIDYEQVKESNLYKYVGKELAVKIANQKEGYKEYIGLDLKVGGEGMKVFYDEKVPGAANRLFKKYGTKVGETRIDFAGEVKSVPYLPIVNDMRTKILSEGLPLFQGKKGATEILSDGQMIIHAFENADVTTMLHEAAHVFRKQLPEEDNKTVLDWAGAKSFDIVTEEKFARGFERYMAEGKAPNSALKDIFEKFKNWLLEIYKKIKNSAIDIKLNDNIRKLFDKIVSGGEKIVTEKTAAGEQIVSTELKGQAKMSTGKIRTIPKGESVAGEILKLKGKLNTERAKLKDLKRVSSSKLGNASTAKEILKSHRRIKDLEGEITKLESQPDLFEKEPKGKQEKLFQRKTLTEAGAVKKIARKGIFPIAKLVEPAKLAEWKHGADVVADVIKAWHHPEAEKLFFTEKKIGKSDKTFGDIEKYLNDNFKDKELENFMLTRGNPKDIEGIILKKEAIKNLSSKMKRIYNRTFKVTQLAADNAYRRMLKYMKEAGKNKGLSIDEMAELNFYYADDYFRGIYKNNDAYRAFRRQLKKAINDKWRTSKSFLNPKTFATYADAKAVYGLELKNPNPITNIKSEISTIERLRANNWLREILMENGDGTYIMRQTSKKRAPEGWKPIGAEGDPVWNGIWAEPELARLINNMLSINKITTSKTGRFFWQFTNYMRGIKFVGSTYHQWVVDKQAYADNGWFGFLNPKKTIGTTAELIRTSKKSHAKIMKDPDIRKAYKEYIRLGGTPVGNEGSFEYELAAIKTFEKLFDKMGLLKATKTKAGKTLLFVPKLPFGYVNWLFRWHIPALKRSAYLKDLAVKEKKLGRELTDSEKISIIKEGQNFYGEMNERLFGRSGTMTTLMRFIWMAPGFAEGNYRTNIKALLQWSKGGPGNRSRYNIVNSLLLTLIISTIGTYFATKKFPKKPEILEDVRDLFKIDTGLKDDKERKIMIDMLTYDKDYYEIYGKLIFGPRETIIPGMFKRMGGMKSGLFELATDVSLIMQGKALRDWKEDRIIYITDSATEKLLKLIYYEWAKVKPISASVISQARRRGLDDLFAFIVGVSGARLSYTEKKRREFEQWKIFYDLRNKRTDLYRYLKTIKNPEEKVAKYNEQIEKFINNKALPEEIREVARGLLIKKYQRHGLLKSRMKSRSRKLIKSRGK